MPSAPPLATSISPKSPVVAAAINRSRCRKAVAGSTIAEDADEAVFVEMIVRHRAGADCRRPIEILEDDLRRGIGRELERRAALRPMGQREERCRPWPSRPTITFGSERSSSVGNAVSGNLPFCVLGATCDVLIARRAACYALRSTCDLRLCDLRPCRPRESVASSKRP